MSDKYLDQTGLSYFWNKIKNYVTNSVKVTGVKGDKESSYRTGNVNLTPANIGAVSSVQVQATNPVQSSSSSASSTTLNTTISLADGYGDTKNPYGSKDAKQVLATPNNESGVPGFRNLLTSDIFPLQKKIYTGVIGTADNWAGATFFFASIRPTTWDEVWEIKYRIRTYVPGVAGYDQFADVLITGYRDALKNYYSNNTIQSSVAYYHDLYRLKQAGFNNGYGHLLGISLRSSNYPTNTNYKRTVEIEVYQTRGCTVTFLDNCIKYADAAGTGSTNYNTYSEINYISTGLQELSDSNDVNYQNRIYYTLRKTYTSMPRYQISYTMKDAAYVFPTTTISNNVATLKTFNTTVPFDPFGEIYYYNSTTLKDANTILGDNTLYRQVLADLRYSFNIIYSFSNSVTYAVGDYVIYGEALYKCTTAHPAANWNASHFTVQAPKFATNTAYSVNSYVMYSYVLYKCTTAHAAGAWNADHFTRVSKIEGHNILLVARMPVYLVAVPQSDGSAVLHSDPITQDLPQSADNLIYIYLGNVYPDTVPYRIDLTLNHPVYEYKNGAIRQWTNAAINAVTVNGHTVNSDVPSNAVFTDTTYTFDGTYNASTNKAATVSTVTNAINALDGGTIGTPGVGKTLTALSQTNGNISATFSDISIDKSQITGFPTTMPPSSHTHGNIQNGGTLQTNDVTIASGDKLVITDSSDSSKVARASIAFDGSTATKALTQKGTWESFTNNTGTVTQITAGSGLSMGTTAGGSTSTTGTINHTNSVTAQTTQALYPIKIDAQGHISAYGSAVTSMAPTSHTHGNIQNGGTLQTNDITVANGDKLVVTDSSDSSKIARTSISFDGSTTTKALTPKGTWETFNNYSLPLAASGTRGGVQIGYSESGKKYAVKLDNEKMYVEVPWTDNNTTYSAGTGISLSGTTFSNSGVTGVKGNSETNYRTGQVNLTAANIGAVAKSGDTMTGKLTLQANQYADSYTSGALDLQNSNILNVNGIYTADASDDSKEGINFYRDATHVDTIYAKSGILYFVPNRTLGSVGTSKKILFEGSDSPFYEAYLAWGGKHFNGNYGCIDAAMIPDLGANRFAFLKAAGLEIEYSRDGGTTWLDYEATNTQKTGLFGKGQGFYLGKASVKADNNINNQLRIIITTNTASLYTVLNKIAIYMSTSGNTVQVKIEKATKGDPTTYTTHLDWTAISGWSGWNILNISGLTTYGNTDSQYQKIKITFQQTAINTNYSSASISRIMGFGGVGWVVPSNMAATGHLYNYDNDQNATFPAQITATQFNGPATKLGTSTIGGTDRPIYLNAGTATQTTYRMAATNTAATTAVAITSNLDTGIWYVNGTNSTDLYSQSDGAVYVNKYNDSWLHEIYGDYRTGQIAIRGKNNGTWQNWRKVIDSVNFATSFNYLGEGSSPAQRNDYIIAQYAGGGTTTTTYHRRSLANIFKALNSSDITTALSYTPYDSTNPNGYTTNTGTVTKVTAGTGLSIGTTAGGDLTTTGTINHTNSITAQTTQAIYPIKIDAQGHISAYGSAVTPLTSHQTIKQDGITGATVNRFGTCGTAAATAAKTVSITSGTFALETGAKVTVKFTYGNTAGTPTLNVNSKGAKNIFHNGSQITTGSNKALLAGTVDFVYDGIQWHLIGNYIDTTYSSKTAASGGTDVSLVTTGEKYTWNNKTSNTGTVTSVQVQATSPLQSSTSSAQSSTLNTTISFTNQSANAVLAGPSSGSAAAPTFRSLVAADIPDLAWSKITSGNDDLKAIQNLTGTSGLLKKTAANTWTLDTTSYSTLTIGTTATTAAAGNHTHTASLATDTGTSAITLAHGGKYKLTAGGSSVIFTMPSDNNTTYTFAGGTNKFTVTPSGGTAQDITITPSITNNITGSGTSGYLAKFNGGNTITNGPQLGSATTTFLRNDGSWATPVDEKIKLTSQSTSGSYPILFGPTSITSNSSYSGYYNTGLTYNPNTKALTTGGTINGYRLAAAATKGTMSSPIPYEAMRAGADYDDTVPTTGAVGELLQAALDYVTPQMFGAIADGNADDTDALQAAFDFSKNVYIPKGTYLIRAPIVLQSHAHVWGCGQESLIRADANFSIDNIYTSIEDMNTFLQTDLAKNMIRGTISYSKGAMLVVPDGIQSYTAGASDGKSSNINIEHIKLDCNNVTYLDGIRLIRPYNDSVIRDVLIVNTGFHGIYVGDETEKSNSNVASMTDGDYTKAVRSQTLVVDNCYIEASKTIEPKAALGYFFNSFELNLKDTKFLHSSSQIGNQPCVVLRMGTDAYVRGCSFAHTLGEAIRIKNYSMQFRLMNNTYENLGTESDAIVDVYIRSGVTAKTQNWFSTTSGGDALTPSTSKVYKLKQTSGSYTAGSLYYWTGSAYADYTNTIRDYCIALLGDTEEPNLHSQGLGKVSKGLIMETLYANVPRKIKVDYAEYNLAIGNFTEYISTNSAHNRLYDTMNKSFKTDDSNCYMSFTETGHLVLGMNSAGTGGGRIGLKDSTGTAQYLYAGDDNYLHVVNAAAGTNRTIVDKTYVDNKANSEATSVVNTAFSNKITCKTYSSISTVANSSVSPWGAFKSFDISSDISSYGIPVAIYTGTSANNNPSCGNIKGVTARVYTRNATSASDLQVTIMFMKDINTNMTYSNGAISVANWG